MILNKIKNWIRNIKREEGIIKNDEMRIARQFSLIKDE